MKSEELFRYGFAAAVEFMKDFDGDAVVTDDLVEALGKAEDGAYQEFKTTEPGKTLVFDAAAAEADRMRSAKARGFRAGHRAAEGVVNVYVDNLSLRTGLTDYIREKQEANLANFQAAEEGRDTAAQAAAGE